MTSQSRTPDGPALLTGGGADHYPDRAPTGPWIYALDPGAEQSALIWTDGLLVVDQQIAPNEVVLNSVKRLAPRTRADDVLVIEMMKARGQPCYQQVLIAAWWAGRFAEAWLDREGLVVQLTRDVIKHHILGTNRGSDSNVRAALIDRFGGKAFAVGTKKNPGPLFALKKDGWAAFAAAVTYRDTHNGRTQ